MFRRCGHRCEVGKYSYGTKEKAVGKPMPYHIILESMRHMFPEFEDVWEALASDISRSNGDISGARLSVFHLLRWELSIVLAQSSVKETWRHGELECPSSILAKRGCLEIALHGPKKGKGQCSCHGRRK